jgi:hypothetical protein
MTEWALVNCIMTMAGSRGTIISGIVSIREFVICILIIAIKRLNCDSYICGRCGVVKLRKKSNSCMSLLEVWAIEMSGNKGFAYQPIRVGLFDVLCHFFGQNYKLFGLK